MWVTFSDMWFALKLAIDAVNPVQLTVTSNEIRACCHQGGVVGACISKWVEEQHGSMKNAQYFTDVVHTTKLDLLPHSPFKL